MTSTVDPGADPGTDKEQTPAEFLQYSSNLDLRTSFSRALRLLKNYVTGRDYRYRVPWFLMIGESDSGKTTVLKGTGHNLSGEALEVSKQQLNWFFFDEGLVIDVAGDFVLREDLRANHRGWNTISNLLQKHRPRRPLDGIVLAIPCSDLIGPDALKNKGRFRWEQKAICLYKKLWQAQRVLGMRLPVYVLITKCDEVTGFSSFCNQLPDKLQTQMFGWSNPSTLETAYRPDLLSEAFASLHKYLSRLQFEIYAEKDEIENVDDLFLFPGAMQSMRAPLQVYLDGIFKQSAYHESFFFRGLYFCGETPIKSIAQPAPRTALENHWTEALYPHEGSLPAEIESSDRKPIFVTELFKEKIFAEDFLAQPIKRVALSRNRTVLAAQVISLLIILVGGVGLAIRYYQLSQRREALSEFLQKEIVDLDKVKHSNETTANTSAQLSTSETQSRADALRTGEKDLLSLMAKKVDGTRFSSIFIPASWFDGIDQRLEDSIAGAFNLVIFESLRAGLDVRMNQAVQTPPNSFLFPNECTVDPAHPAGSNTTALLKPTEDQSFELPLYIEKLGTLRSQLDRYERIASEDSGSINDLSQLVLYLCHDPIPPGFEGENHLYKRALHEARGNSIDRRGFYQGSADNIAAMIDELFKTSFPSKSSGAKGVQYHRLGEITRAENLLRRSEYTWLATYIIRPPSTFQNMTISSALVDLRRALQDLERQRFMSDEAPDETDRYQRRSTPRYQHAVRSVLVWDQETLQRVIALNDEYETFVGTRSYDASQQLDNTVREAARARVKLKMQNLMLRARKYQPVPPSPDGSALKASLITEVQNLRTAEPTLTRTLEVLGRIGADHGLRAMLAEQGAYLLRSIQREFVAERFYVGKQSDCSVADQFATDFCWWDGTQPVSYIAYGLSSKEDLTAYLNIQRKNISFLGRELVVPVLAFLNSQNIYVPRDPQIDWNEILTDLDAFDNKTPGNPIAALETFIRSEMDRVSIESCSASPRLSEESSTDYFLSIRNFLRLKFYARCKEVAYERAIKDTLADLENYRTIEESFNDNLLSRFPFSRASGPPVDPSALSKFFKDFDLKEKAAREALNRSETFGADPKPATEFLDQVDKVRVFFAPFLEKNLGPVFDFKLQFRVPGEPVGQKEIGGNQIIDWKLEVGSKKFANLNDDLTGRWVYGDAIRLTLRWANDSPMRPVASAIPNPFVVKERTAIFEYNDPWSLFTLVLRHGLMLRRAGTTPECSQGFDPDPYTLKFTIRTETDPAGLPVQSDDLKRSQAEVFMRVSMLGAKPEPLMLPCFPTKAPRVPSLYPDKTRTATNKD